MKRLVVGGSILAVLTALMAGCASTGSGSGSTASSGSSSNKSSSSSSNPLAGLSSALSSVDAGGQGASSKENKAGAALDLFKAATVSEEELMSASVQMRACGDRKNQVAPPGNKYAQRLARLTAKHLNEDGLKLNFKVYLSNQVNANASPDGSIRFYSGLMDMMTDAELLGIIGHEIGHVKAKHSLGRMRTAYMASAGRKAAASSKGALGALADSELGGLAEAVLNAQYSQSNETEADDYGLAFMKKHKYDARAMESAFRKLGSGGGGMLSSHPNSQERANRMRDKLGSGK
ncbi:MAG: M48 family metalloprotease [Burkholderiales bacterium]